MFAREKWTMRPRLLALMIAASSIVSTTAHSQTLVSTGSGFLVNDSGWVLTNAHVVEGCDIVRETNHGDAVSVITDAERDLAVVLFRAEFNGAPLPIRKDPARLTEPVVALGFPLSDILGNEIRATTGTVSSLSGIQGDPRFIQISAPIQPGNSGGPVLDANGAVIGIATSKLNDRDDENFQNINFAVTAREAAGFIAKNGLSFIRASDDPVEANPGFVDGAARSTFLLQCLVYQPESPSPNEPQPYAGPDTVSQAPGMVSFNGMDVLGLDYLTIRDVSLNSCQASCEADLSCRAYTFNTRYDVCFLKSDAIVIVENGNAVGGFDADLADDVVDSGLVVTSDMDSPGGDFQRITDSDFVGCALACGVDLRCQAFAFVRRTGDCWLKDSVGPLQSIPGVEFGIRR